MRRWWTIPLSGIAFVLLIVFLVGLHARRVRSREWCGLDQHTPRLPQIRTVDADWTWHPPGFDCIYMDGSGREVARHRAYPP